MAHIFCSRYISRLIKFVCLIGIVFHCTAAMSAYTFTNMVTGGVLTTPTTYEVTITKVEFQKSSGSYVTFVEGTYVFDLGTGGTAAGEQAGICPGTPPPPGTYTSMRITISDTFSVTGSVTDANTVAGSNQPGRTNTGNASTATVGGTTLTNVGVATTDGAAATKQSIPIPTGTAVTTTLTTAGITRSGGNLTVSFAVSFTIPEDADTTSIPSVQMDFDITDTLNFFPADSGIGMIPLPPSLTFSLN
ncbi:MAG: hypothetical protein HOF76_03030 [Candidatus Scalindua sp.]|jgi:hypothetical protein|nr:hypothetical protein [Candidatus Scalindua sp.]MBT6051701.1 hypothetical protein [Candidatus Scalindua sp.]